MLCVWPEILQKSHWLNNVYFDFVNENFIFKNIMIDIVNEAFINLKKSVKVNKKLIYLVNILYDNISLYVC